MTTIGEMKIGSEGWTVPWAAHKPKGWRWLLAECYLNARYEICPEPGGTRTLKVTRDSRGWHLDDSCFKRGWDCCDVDSYHGYWSNGRSVPVRSIKL